MKARFLTMLLLSVVAMALSATVASVFPDIAWLRHRGNAEMLWSVVVETEPRTVDMQSASLVPILERTIRAEGAVENLTIHAWSDLLVAHFQTDRKTNPRTMRENLEARVAGIKTIPGIPDFQSAVVYQPLDVLQENSAARRNDELFFQFQEEFLGKEKPGYEFAERADLVYGISDFHGQRLLNLENLQRVLHRIQSLPGVQVAVARDVNFTTLRADLDLVSALATGVQATSIAKAVKERLNSSIQASQEHVFPEFTVHLTESAPSHPHQIETIPILDHKTGQTTSLGDISQVAFSHMRLDTVTSRTSGLFLERHLRTAPESPQDARLYAVLEHQASPRQTMQEIEHILSEEQIRWSLLHRPPVPSSLVWLFAVGCCGTVLVALGCLWFTRFNQRAFLLAEIGLALTLWSAIAVPLRIDVPAESLVLLCLGIGTTQLARWLLPERRAVRTHLPLMITWVGSLSAAIVAFALTDGDELFLTDATLANLVACLAPLLSFSLMPHPVAQELPPPQAAAEMSIIKAHWNRTLLSLAVLAGLTAAVFSSAHRNDQWETVQALITFPPGKPTKFQGDLIEALHDLARRHDARLSAKGTTFAPRILMTPGRNAHALPPAAQPGQIATAYVPRLPGKLVWNSPMSPTPVVLMPHRAASTLDGVLSFLDTAQIPIRLPEHGAPLLQPLSALYDVEVQPALVRRTHTSRGETLHATLQVRGGGLAPLVAGLTRLPHSARIEHEDLSILVGDSRHARVEGLWKSFDRVMLAAALLALAGGLLFGTLTRTGLTLATSFLVLSTFWGMHQLGLQWSHHSELFSTGPVWAGMNLLVVWFIIEKTSDTRRRMNMTLETALAVQLRLCRHVFRMGAPVVLLTMGLALWFPSLRIAATYLCGTWFIASFMIPEWVLLWSHAFERWNRFFLRNEIALTLRMAKKALVLALAGTALCLIPHTGQAATQKSVSAACADTATAILPIIGRPKGNEPPPLRAFLAEKLMQETPCSWPEISFESEIISILAKYRAVAEQDKIIDELSALVQKNRESIQTSLLARARESVGNPGVEFKVRVYGGYFEEFFGNTSLTIIEFPEKGEPVLSKITIPESQQTEGIAFLASFMRGESVIFFEELLGQSARIPVYIEPVQSLDQHPISENLAREINLFLRSRFLYPISFNLFERKTFFRAEEKRENSQFSLDVKIRKQGTRLYASITTAAQGGKRRQAWIEGDISQLPAFEEDILSVSKKDLSQLEGIVDYGVFLSMDSLVSEDSWTRLYGLTFRQNFGNAALGLRLRGGNHEGRGNVKSTSLLSLGGSAGWQFTDFRWLVADAGLSLDLGLATATMKTDSTSTANETERSPFFTYGPYIQAQLVSKKNLTVIGRAGLEQPQLLASSDTRSKIFETFYLNVLVGVGFAF